MIEEYLANLKVDQSANKTADPVVKTGVNRNFAFWISFFMILGLLPTLICWIMRDKKEIRIYGIHGNNSIHQYALFFFICLALRRKRKYNRDVY